MLILLTLILAVWEPATTEGRDYYPEIRQLLLEAERAAAAAPKLTNGYNPMSDVARRFAHGGYLSDAARAAAKANFRPGWLARERALHGDLDGALNEIRAVTDPLTRTGQLDSLSGTLWRMGDELNARLTLAEAERISRSIADPAQRAVRQRSLAMALDALSDPPPDTLSPAPAPQPPPPAPALVAAALPPFPINVDGYRQMSTAARAKEADTDRQHLVTLYALAGAQDSTGLQRHTQKASSRRQKLLALASLEHLLIQVGEPGGAEEAARAMSGDGLDGTLAKSEALAAASAWARAKNLDQAVRCFSDASAMLGTVRHPALALGQAKVAANIAALEAAAHLTSASAKSFDRALSLARKVPLASDRPSLFLANSGYRDDAVRDILTKANRAGNMTVVALASQALIASTRGQAAGWIATQWLEAGRVDEAMAYARTQPDPRHRAAVLLSICRRQLNDAGAPNL